MGCHTSVESLEPIPQTPYRGPTDSRWHSLAGGGASQSERINATGIGRSASNGSERPHDGATHTSEAASDCHGFYSGLWSLYSEASRYSPFWPWPAGPNSAARNANRTTATSFERIWSRRARWTPTTYGTSFTMSSRRRCTNLASLLSWVGSSCMGVGLGNAPRLAVGSPRKVPLDGRLHPVVHRDSVDDLCATGSSPHATSPSPRSHSSINSRPLTSRITSVVAISAGTER